MCVQSVELAVSSLAAISDGGFFWGEPTKHGSQVAMFSYGWNRLDMTLGSPSRLRRR